MSIPEYPDPSALSDWLSQWILSDAFGELALLSGITLREETANERLRRLAGLSEAWDFRQGSERHLLTKRPAVVNGRAISEMAIQRCAAELGLTGGMEFSGKFSHVVALAGMAKATLNRVKFAKRLMDNVGAPKFVVLTAERPLLAFERQQACDAGWGEVSLESEAATAVVSQVFDLPRRPDQCVIGGPKSSAVVPLAVEPGEFQSRLRWREERWRRRPEVLLLSAPSQTPELRRATTGDQLGFWGTREGISSVDRVLLVTTDLYVPAQHLHALRVLGLAASCRIVTTGVPWHSSGPYRGRALLQEIRSAVLAARQLMSALSRSEEA